MASSSPEAIFNISNCSPFDNKLSEEKDLNRSNAKLVSRDVDVDNAEKVGLKKELDLLSGCTLIIGTIIGSGIFVAPKNVLQHSGSVGVALIVWTGCGILAMLASLCYAELGTSIPLSGAEFAYYMEAWGKSKKHNFFGPIPAFLFAWTYATMIKPCSLAILTLSFATYVLAPFYECGVPSYLKTLTAMIAICLIAEVNCLSVNYAARVQNVFTFAKVTALFIIIIGGIVNLFKGMTDNLHNGFEPFQAGTETSFAKIALACYSGLWAYNSWNNLNYVVEELKNPKDLIRAILISIPAVSFLFVSTNVSYFTVMTPEELLASEAVAVTWADAMLGPMTWIMPMFVAFSTFGSANGSCFTAARITHVAAREKYMPDILSHVHVTRYTPPPAIIVNCLLAFVLVTIGEVDTLIDFFSFTNWLFYGLSMLALIVMRWTKPDLHRPVKVIIVIPILVLLISIYLIFVPIIDQPELEYLLALGFMFAGLIFYIPFVYFAYEPNLMDYFTKFCQLLFEVAPAQAELHHD